jgi:twitching motility two-component system response regulator PilH
MDGKKVLVVDDSATIREIVGDALREVGYQVEMAADGEDGLEKARRLLPDVVILDLTMPKRDGLDVATDIKADPKTANIKIIMLTTRDSEFDQRVGKEVGADKYLSKPFDSQTLLNAVTQVLKK